MGRPSPDYTPKSPAQGVMYQVVRDHFETFRAEAARVYERDALPRFIEEEFRGFLRCGFLAGWLARFHCGRCGLDRLVPFHQVPAHVESRMTPLTTVSAVSPTSDPRDYRSIRVDLLLHLRNGK